MRYKLLILLNFILVFLLLSCSEKTNFFSGPNTVLQDSLILKHKLGEFWYKDTPFTGISFKKNTAGVTVEETMFKSGKKDGKHKLWFDDGTLSYESMYKNGRKNGSTKTWWSNRKLRSENNYNNGVIDGKQTYWYKSGQLFKERNIAQGKEEGLQKSWRENGKLYNNYEAKNGRIFGLKRASLCYALDDEEIQFAD